MGAGNGAHVFLAGFMESRKIAMKTHRHKQTGNAKAATKTVDNVKCAFCDGTGKDPFDLMSSLSQCCVCIGHGKLDVKTPTVDCVYCHGTGRSRHTRLACSGCQGAGVITLAGPTTRCPQCCGSGTESESDLPCSLCRGAGLVARKPREKRKELVATKSCKMS
jgi:DnaJ-class molecular chaperone